MAADSNTAPTDPTKSGTSTSEFKLSLLVAIVGILCEAFSGILTQIQTINPSATWIGPTMSVVGAGMMIASAMGYNKGRVALKMATLATDSASITTTTTSSTASVPIATTTVSTRP